MSDLKLLIFDVDGTLVDSQADILMAMQAGFAHVGLPAPERSKVLSIVGLSLDCAIAELAPDLSEVKQAQIVDAYKDSYVANRTKGHSGALYPGIGDMLDRLAKQDELLLGIATGKSRRGLTALLKALDLENRFVTEQVSDFHPSKPHPAMLLEALREAGVGPEAAIMIGDTSFDMDMAKSAGIFGLGVSWGYHDVQRLGAAAQIMNDIAELPAILSQRWGINV